MTGVTLDNTRELAKQSCCLGKFKFESRGTAAKSLRGKPPRGLEPYRCPFCGFWHVGHKPSAKAKEQWKNHLKQWRKAK